ncbi:hypothetical protein OROHE_021994 [Orobanche hederae]
MVWPHPQEENLCSGEEGREFTGEELCAESTSLLLKQS